MTTLSRYNFTLFLMVTVLVGGRWTVQCTFIGHISDDVSDSGSGTKPSSQVSRKVELGGAIVAAMEEDIKKSEEDQRLQMVSECRQCKRSWWGSGSDYVPPDEIERQFRAWQSWLTDIETGRGKKHKHRKLFKMLYPMFVALIVAKIILIPFILKAVMALSTTAFVFSKVALAVSGLLTLRWLFTPTTTTSDSHDGKAHTHFEFVQIPVVRAPAKTLMMARPPATNWNDDLLWSGSNTSPSRDAVVSSLYNYIPTQGVATTADANPSVGQQPFL